MLKSLKNLVSRNTTNISNDNDNDIRYPDRLDSAPPTTEIDPDTLQNLVGIAVNILKQNIDNENQTMTNLVGIAVDILKQSLGTSTADSIYTMPKPDVRYSDLSFEVIHKDNGGKPETKSIISTIRVLYDDENDKLKITGYSIKNGETGETNEIYKKIIEELSDINLGDLNEPIEKKTIITNIIEKLKKDEKIDQKDEKIAMDYLDIYLDKLGEAVNQLKRNVVGMGNDVNRFLERF
jgi:hypothetical protein